MIKVDDNGYIIPPTFVEMVKETIKEPLKIHYYEDADILVINGIHYTGEIFRTLAMPIFNHIYAFEITKDLPERVIIHSFTNGNEAEEFLKKKHETDNHSNSS